MKHHQLHRVTLIYNARYTDSKGVPWWSPSSLRNSGINPVGQLEVVQSQLYFQGTATPAYTLPERSRKRRNCPVHRYFAYTRYLIAMKEVQELPVMLPMQPLYV